MKTVMFSKLLQHLSIAELAATVADLGFDGVDLTVRPGGHIEPEETAERLPEAVEVCAEHGLEIPMITTAITSADDPTAEPIVATAAEVGVEAIKCGYWPYREFGRLNHELLEMDRDLNGLQDLAAAYELPLTLHIHSGDYLTAEAALVHRQLAGRNPKHMGAYIDPGHMALEGGLGGWKQGIDLLAPWLKLVAVKNMAWVPKAEDEAAGDGPTRPWRWEVVPVRDGLAPWPEVMECLKAVGYDGIFSLHSEYHDLSHDELLAQTRADLAYIKELWEEAP